MKRNFPISATFIDEVTFDMPSPNYSFKQWAKELDYMKKFGIDTVVFIRGGLRFKCIYPSKIFPTLLDEKSDLLGFILKECEKRKMHVYIGLYMVDDTWHNGDYEDMARRNDLFTKEVVERYGHYKSFEGWYLPTEVCYEEFNITKTLNLLVPLCKKITPEKKIIISPIYKSSVFFKDPKDCFTPEQTRLEWEKIFKDVGKDIHAVAFQDGTCPLDELENNLIALKKMCEKFGMELWSNVELFERDVRNMLPPISFELLRRKIEINERHCVKLLSFNFSYSLSPQSIQPSAQNLSKLYYSFYKKR